MYINDNNSYNSAPWAYLRLSYGVSSKIVMHSNYTNF
jgi:hypothetical protein